MNENNLITLEYDKIISELMQLAVSVMGKQRSAELLPSSDLWEIEAWQNETADAETILLSKGSPPLQGLHDIAASVMRAEHGASLNCLELMHVASFLKAAERLKKFVPEAGAGENSLYQMMTRLLPLTSLAGRIDQAIISEDEVADGASQKLASIRHKQRQVQNGIKATLESILRNQSKALQDNIITQRSGRYVLPVKAEFRGQVPGVVHDASGSGATLFVEPMAVVNANNQLRELAADERDEIERILAAFSAEVADESVPLRSNAAILEQLDFAFAKGRLAQKMKATRPVLDEKGFTQLKQARHPLIPADKVVPIDLHIGAEFKTLVITGPNTGGKTVALKTLGLLTLMAQAGLHIPAREPSRIAVFEQVLADIGDEQSIEQNLSTFSAHMRHLVDITREVNSKSLVLLDELGSGTDPTEGAALAVALLDYFAKKGAVTMATTHYKELKAYAIQTQGVENACCEFDTETLQPTYRLLIGVPGVSNAFIISQKLGLRDEIIAVARRQLSQSNLQFEELIKEIEFNKTLAMREREAAERERREFKVRLEELTREKDKLKENKAGILAKAREAARSDLEEELEIIDAYLEEIKDLMKDGDLEQARKIGQSLRHSVKRRHGEVESAIGQATLNPGGTALSPEDIVQGEMYYAPGLNLVGKALTLTDGKGMVSLQSGGIKLQVKANSLMPADAAPQALRDSLPKGNNKTHQKLVSQRRQNFHSEVKLLGMTADEAISNLDRFLDDAVLSGAATVRIVHGKGTGVLRKAVGEFIKRDKRVKSSRIAAYGEGDSGVTIADLR